MILYFLKDKVAAVQRFFIPPAWISSGRVTFDREYARQMVVVLRLRMGQHVVALDNNGSEYEVELETLDAQRVTGRILAQRAVENEPRARLALYLTLTAREKFEWMLQKCTELGAVEFTPVVTSRSVVADTGGVEKKYERWRYIIREAAEQSGRGRLPVLQPSLPFARALQTARQNETVLIPWEGEHVQGMGQALAGLGKRTPARLALFIGPEGGFAEAEVEQARKAGAIPVTLGRRILRMETAAMAAAALALYCLGEMGGEGE